jgi:hypothetical protein
MNDGLLVENKHIVRHTTISTRSSKMSKRENFEAAFKVNPPVYVTQPNNLHKWIFCFSPQVTYLDGIAQCK